MKYEIQKLIKNWKRWIMGKYIQSSLITDTKSHNLNQNEHDYNFTRFLSIGGSFVWRVSWFLLGRHYQTVHLPHLLPPIPTHPYHIPHPPRRLFHPVPSASKMYHSSTTTQNNVWHFPTHNKQPKNVPFSPTYTKISYQLPFIEVMSQNIPHSPQKIIQQPRSNQPKLFFYLFNKNKCLQVDR